jgi:hypothetical protein
MAGLVRRGSIALCVSIVVASCGGSTPSPEASSIASPEPSTVSASPSETAAPSVSTTATASASAAAGKLCAKEFEACALPAGTYRAGPFEPGFTFTVDGDDWVNQRAWPHGGGVTYTDGAFFWMTGPMSGMIDDKAVKVGDAPEDMVKFLDLPKDWVVADPQPVTVDGVNGVSVDTVTGPKARPGLLTFPEDAFNTDPKEKIRWIVLDKDGKTVVFLLDAFKEADFDAVSARVQPVLDSVKWE